MIYQKQILFFSFQNILQKKLKIIQKNGVLNYLKKDILKVQHQSLFKILTLVDYKTKKINFGNAFCFSGNHIHGSNLGNLRRLNIETRTLCKKDVKNLIYQKMLIIII